MALNQATVRLGRLPKHISLEGFDIADSIAYLVAQLEKQRTARFGTPAFQSGFTDPPAFGQFSLGHASFSRHMRPSIEVVGIAMKALFAGEAKSQTQNAA